MKLRPSHIQSRRFSSVEKAGSLATGPYFRYPEDFDLRVAHKYDFKYRRVAYIL